MKPVSFFMIFCSFMIAGGCNRQTDKPVNNTNRIFTADPYLQLINKEIDQYKSLYPNVDIETRGTSTRDAIVQLLNDSVRCIVVDRQFNDEELQILKQLPFKIAENKIAADGIAIIVNKKNPIRGMDIGSVRRLIAGETKYWNQIEELNWPYSVELVLTGRNSGMFELLQKDTSLSTVPKPSVLKNSQQEIVQYITAHPNSVGCVAASLAANSKEEVKIVPVRNTAGNDRKEYYPGQEEIYFSLYPFRYSLYFYNGEVKTNFGLGFSAFVLSNFGQKIIQRAGLVPAAIPYRTIQLNAE